MRAHVAGCRHVQGGQFEQKRHMMATMMDIVEFVDSKQKGNVTIARRDMSALEKDMEILSRLSFGPVNLTPRKLPLPSTITYAKV